MATPVILAETGATDPAATVVGSPGVDPTTTMSGHRTGVSVGTGTPRGSAWSFIAEEVVSQESMSSNGVRGDVTYV